MKRIVLSLTVALSLTATACREPVKAKDVAATTSQATAALVKEVGTSAQAINSLSSFKDVTALTNTFRSGFNGVSVSGAETRCAATPDKGCVEPEPTPLDMPSAPPQADVDKAVEELTRYLTERIFIDANVETTDSTSATFLLPGAAVCSDGSAPADAQCVDYVDKLQLRIRAMPVTGGVDLVVVIGPARSEPLTLLIRSTSLAAQVNLASAKAAIEHAASIDKASVDLPRVMEGVLELKLQKNGEQDFTLTSSILAAVRVEVDDAQGQARTFTTAVRSPLASVRLEGVPKRITVDAELGESEYTGPYSEISRSGKAGKRVAYHLAGASFAFTAQDGQQDLAVAHVGLGDVQSTVKLDGVVLFSADVNPLSNRHFDFSVSRDTDGQPLVRVMPELDLIAKFVLQPLKIDSDVQVPAFYENETYHLKLSGAQAPAVKPLKADPSKSFHGGLKLVKGSLNLETSKAGVAPIVVPEGSCLVDRDVLAPNAHPLLGHLAVQACP